MSFFQRLFGRKVEPVESVDPPRPKDWSLTVEDLMREMHEGKRKLVGHPELDWAREYERSLIPKGHRFPRKGDLYEAKKEMEVNYLTSWAAPYTGGDKAKIFKGERFWVDSDPIDSDPIGSYALAVNYDDLEQRIIPSSDVSSATYGGFYFFFDTVMLNDDFKLIDINYKQDGQEAGLLH